MKKPPKPIRRQIEGWLNEQFAWLQSQMPPDVVGPSDYQFDHPIAGWSLALYRRPRCTKP